MPGKTRHLSKTDLRRGLFTKSAAPPASAATPVALPGATSADEQALLFDLPPLDALAKTRSGKSVNAAE